jgi:hypothetical protein
MSLLDTLLASARAVFVKPLPDQDRRDIENNIMFKEILVELKKLNKYMHIITGEKL